MARPAAIGAGFQSVLVADIRSAEDVRACIRAVRPDTPTGGGSYGAADRRNSFWSEAATAGYITALEEIVVVAMIEKHEAVDQLDEILAVPGLDMIQWGPADYAMSIGRPGGWYDAEVRAVERDVLAWSLAAGIQPRAEITDPEDAGTTSISGSATSASGPMSTSSTPGSTSAAGSWPRSWARSDVADREAEGSTR